MSSEKTDKNNTSTPPAATDEEVLFIRSTIKTTPPDKEMTADDIRHAIVYLANAYLVFCGRLLGIKHLDKKQTIDFNKVNEVGKYVSVEDILNKSMTGMSLVTLLRLVDQDLAVSFCTYGLEPDRMLYDLVNAKAADTSRRRTPFMQFILPFRVVNKTDNDGMRAGAVSTLFPVSWQSQGQRLPVVFAAALDGRGHNLEGLLADVTAYAKGYFFVPTSIEQVIGEPELATNY